MPSRDETETVIVLHDADDFAVVDTMHGRYRRACEEIIRRTGKGRERNPEGGKLDGRKVRWEFEVPKECISIRPRRSLSPEQRERAAARAREIRSRKLPNATSTDVVGGPDAAGEGEGQGSA